MRIKKNYLKSTQCLLLIFTCDFAIQISRNRFQPQSKQQSKKKTKPQSNLIDRLISGNFRLQMISLGYCQDQSKTHCNELKPDANGLWCCLPHYLRAPKMNSDGRYECPQESCHKNYKEVSSLQRHIR